MRSVLFITIAACLVAATLGAYTQADVARNDINTLQYALTLEHIEAYFYTRGQATFTAAAFVAAGYNAADYDYFTMIKNHEIAHVRFLSSAITTLGVTPVVACGNYNFALLGVDPFANVTSYINVASQLEPYGTGAYVQASSFITNKDYLTAAATILTVEARHAQYILNLVARGSNPANNQNFPVINPGFDVATVARIIAPLNATCITPQLTSNGNSLPVNTLDANVNYTQYSLSSSSASNPVGQDALNANDAALLNYALYLEYLEAAFYQYFVGNSTTPGIYTAATFASAGFASYAFPYFQLISLHEASHVATIQAALRSAGFPYVAPCQYNFASIAAGGVATFVSTAAYVLEPTGVAAYDGAVNAASSRSLTVIAAGIAATEARHASILAVIANQTVASSRPIGPFPFSFDNATAPATIRSAVLSSTLLTEINGCVPSIFPPQVYYQYSNYTAPPTTTSGLTSSTTGASTTGPVNGVVSFTSVFAFALMIVFVVVLYL